MIYMVDHVFADSAAEPAWHAWYAGYLHKLTAVPGIRSAQRFKALGCSPSRFLAMYTVDSADVFTSEPYKAMGGGGSQSARFHSAYRLWTRNLFVAAPRDDTTPATTDIRAPAVAETQRVLVFDRDRHDLLASNALEAQATWLQSVGLHMTTQYRAFLVLDASVPEHAGSALGSFLYAPFTPVIA